MTDFAALLQALTSHKVRFIVVGGAAAIAHGSATLTQDLDIVYARDAQNLRSLAASLSQFQPYLRGAPPGLPFSLDEATLTRGLNFTLTTTLGAIDLLGEIVGGGTYQDLAPKAILLPVFDASCLCLSLSQLLAAKRAAGRPKDLQALAELEILAQETES